VPPANYVLKYNIMPYVGVLIYGEAVKTSEAIAFSPAQSRQWNAHLIVECILLFGEAQRHL
jgi:hypothetical protein